MKAVSDSVAVLRREAGERFYCNEFAFYYPAGRYRYRSNKQTILSPTSMDLQHNVL